MSRISVVFGNVQTADKATYLSQRILLLHSAGAQRFNSNQLSLTSERLDGYVNDISQSVADGHELPLAPFIDLNAIPGAAGEALRKSRDCMLDELHIFFPLLDGEVVTNNEASYLTKNWEGYNANAIVLKQTTNFAVSYYIYPDLFADVENQRLVHREEPEAMMMEAPRLSLRDGGIDFGDVARQLAGGMAGQLPSPLNKIGTMLISQIWPGPDKAAEQWQKVYDALQTIVRNGLAQNNVTMASNKVKGFMSFLTNEYNPVRTTGRTPKAELATMLAPYGVAFNLDIVNVFMFTSSTDANTAAATLANFMTGACLHLALNQERALQDANVTDASLSGFAATVKSFATTYGEYATKTAKLVRQMRLDQISGVKHKSDTSCRGGASGGCTTFQSYWFEDSNTGFKSQVFGHSSSQKKPPNSQADAQRARDAYYNDIANKMDAQLKKQVTEVVDAWEKLKTNPIPIK